MDNKPKDKIKLLVVDDEIDACESIRAHFKRRGFIVLTAGSGEDALQIIKEEPPDVILLDINLPGMSGIDLLKLVREFNLGVRTILVSGSEVSSQHDSQVNDLNVFEVIRKPVTFDALDEVIKKAISL